MLVAAVAVFTQLLVPQELVARVVEAREATLEMEQPEQLILVVVVAVDMGQELAAQAAPALSSCPTPCQKVQYLLLPLLEHLEAQQHPLLLTTWL